jgi:maleamate amidohydrolase
MAYVPDIIPPDERARYVKGNMGRRVGFGARPAAARDLVVTKTKPSAFFGTPLASVLTYLGADTLIVTGIECVADRSLTSHQVNLFDMDMKYADVVPPAEVLSHLARG